MQADVVIYGRVVNPTTIELDQPLPEIQGRVEIVVRSSTTAIPTPTSLLDFVKTLPPGHRSKDEIDAQLDAERSGWEG